MKGTASRMMLTKNESKGVEGFGISAFGQKDTSCDQEQDRKQFKPGRFTFFGEVLPGLLKYFFYC